MEFAAIGASFDFLKKFLIEVRSSEPIRIAPAKINSAN